MTETAVIVGASVGGVSTAQALRALGFPGRIVIVGAETEAPYDRPPLSKQFLTGEWDESRLALLPDEEGVDLELEVRLGVPALRLDVAQRSVVLAGGDSVPFDVCVVATGAAARPSPWGDPPGVHVLRSAQDSRALRADLLRGGPVVVVGGGFIGAEVAAAASRLSNDVTVVDPLVAPMSRLVGDELGAVLGGLHGRKGVTTRFGVGVAGITHDRDGLRVLLDDGSGLTASTVVVGIGAVPNDSWLKSSGLLIDNGVVCDEFCRAVGAHDIYAVGDVARWWHRGRGERVRAEHWTNAVEQARCVAHNIVHPEDPLPYEPVEYVWSDQYDWRIQLAGTPGRAAHHDVVGDLTADHPRAAVSYADAAGQLIGVVTLNWPRALSGGRRMLAAGIGAGDAFNRLSALPAPRG